MPPNCYSPETASGLDALFDTLSHRLRREVISYFEERAEGDAATLEGLVTHIEQRLPGSDRETLSSELFHTHLPKLDAHGWLRFDSGTGHVRYEGHAAAGGLLREAARILGDG